MALIKCSECGNEVNEKKHNKKKLFAIIGIIVVTMVIVLAVVLIKNANKGTTYVVKACKELAEAESGLPDIKAIYTSEKAVKAITSEKVDGGFSTIDYVYRVYIEYSSGQGKNAVMYIVDNKGETYYITEHSSEILSRYLSLAEMEIFGLKGYWGPNRAWVKLSSSEISKMEEKVRKWQVN